MALRAAVAAVREARARVETRYEARRRVPWPEAAPPAGERPRVALVCVNYNTIRATAHLVFSLNRVLLPGEFSTLVIVDNRSTDDSTGILPALDDAGLATVIERKRRPYHGPGLNGGVSFLAQRQDDDRYRADYVCVVDSDVVALRPGGIAAAIEAMRRLNAPLAGHVRPSHPLWDGYAHVSLNLFDPRVVWQPAFPPFRADGHPGVAMQMALARAGMVIAHVPFYSELYFLHVGRETSRAIRESGDWRNWHYSVARKGHPSHYEGIPGAPASHREFVECFDREVPDLRPEAFLEACSRPERLRFA